MAERDRFTQRNDERGGSRGPAEGGQAGQGSQGRAGAFRGESDPGRGAGGRSEFGGYGGGFGGPSPGRGQGGQGDQGMGGDQGMRGGQGTPGGHGPWDGEPGRGSGGRGAAGYGGQGAGSDYGRGGIHDRGQDGGGGYGGRGAGPSGASAAWAESQSLGSRERPFGAVGRGGPSSDDPTGRGSADAWSDRERYGSGGGTGWNGPSGLGWQTDAGYGAGATGYGGSGQGALGAWTSERGGAGTGVARNRGPKGWQRSDERIHDDVCERLANESGIDPSEVVVEVAGGNVVLTGSVPDRGMKYRIEDIVDGCSGVRDVDNRLRVSRGGLGGLFGTGTMGMGTTTDARGAASTGSSSDDRGDAQGSRGSLLGRLFGFSTGTKLSDLMTRNPRTVGPDDTLDKVALAMKEQDVGAIPVCTGRTLAGMITDRDIVVRAAAAGKPLQQTKVSEVMTTQVHTCYEDDDVESALDRMGDLQVRRIPVLDRSDQLVGIVSLGDFAQRDAGDVEDALQDISKPN